MPEGPELHLAAQFVRNIGHQHLFSGAVVKSDVSWKNPDVPWNCARYEVDAVSRGKELKIVLKDSKSDASASVLFHFGMSGKFEWTTKAELPKHAHLRFFAEKDDMVLSFVDYRRFGRWFLDAGWSTDRGPCVITEPRLFRKNILDNLHDKAFNKPLCEAMLNQKFFNGVGNYLRAEVLYRLKIRPFELARSVLSLIAEKDDVDLNSEAEEVKPDSVTAEMQVSDEGKRDPETTVIKDERSLNQESQPEVKIERAVGDEDADNIELSSDHERADILTMTHRLAKEVVGLGFDGGYFSETRDKWESGFGQWLRCYFKEGMSNIQDHNGRTMWYHGEVGPLAPAGAKRNIGTKIKKEKTEGKEKHAKKMKEETVTKSVTVKTEVKKKRAGRKETIVKNSIGVNEEDSKVSNGVDSKENVERGGRKGKDIAKTAKEGMREGVRKSARLRLVTGND